MSPPFCERDQIANLINSVKCFQSEYLPSAHRLPSAPGELVRLLTTLTNYSTTILKLHPQININNQDKDNISKQLKSLKKRRLELRS